VSYDKNLSSKVVLSRRNYKQRRDAYQVEINFDSKRHRMTLSSLAEAKTYVEQKQSELKNEGLAALVLQKRRSMTQPMLSRSWTVSLWVKLSRSTCRALVNPENGEAEG
jgi:hypothetical protein